MEKKIRIYNLKKERVPCAVKIQADHFQTTAIPSFVDLSPKLPPCYDQGELGSW